jgi:hypothetical protein
MRFFIKMSSYGVFLLSLVILFIVSVSAISITKTDYAFGTTESPQEGNLTDIKLASSGFAPLMGILGGGFYFHNVSLPVIQNASDPSKSLRDLKIGYFLVFLTYAFCGSLGYLGFSGASFQDQSSDTSVTIEQNCLNMFSTTDRLATFIRLCIFFQLMTINALLFACLRAQVLLLVTRKQRTKSQLTNFLINLVLMMPAFCLAVWYPKVGEVAALCAAFSTMLVMYCLPIMTYLRMKHMEAGLDESERDNGLLFRWVACVLALLYGIQVFVLQLV